MRAAEALRGYAGEACRMGGDAWPLWAARLKTARQRVAELLGAGLDEIGFVHNTTHGLLCVANSLPWRPGDNIVTTQGEFPANRYPWSQLAARGVALRAIPPRDGHRFLVDDFIAAMDGRTRLVAVSLVSYASGGRIPAQTLAQACRERGVLLCLDAIQALGAVPLRADDLGCDFLAADGHKWLLGPEGAGLLYVRRERLGLLDETMCGWTARERPWDYGDLAQPLCPAASRFEEGSHNMAGLGALGESLGLFLEIGIEQVWAAIEALTGRLAEGAARRGWRVESPRGDGERSGIVALSRPGVDPAAIAAQLEQRGISVAARHGWLRVSPHFYNTPDQIDALLAALAGIAP
jgi:selenocysteine lyase/cysteine desulfurase